MLHPKLTFSDFHFSNIDEAQSFAHSYSLLKFGVNQPIVDFAKNLAKNFFKFHHKELITNQCVVIPSPYNFVKNAATVLAEHFVKHLNLLLSIEDGNVVELMTIQRKITYINDYGFLSKDDRKSLIDNDSFYVNEEFISGKTLIFIDDVRITGTHEDKLIELMEARDLPNKSIFVYLATYLGNSPSIEADLNFASFYSSGKSDVDNLISIFNTPRHNVIVRPIKRVLGSLSDDDLTKFMMGIPSESLAELFLSSVSEGYYKIPKFSHSLECIKNFLEIAKIL
jgi:hypothetical protein